MVLLMKLMLLKKDWRFRDSWEVRNPRVLVLIDSLEIEVHKGSENVGAGDEGSGCPPATYSSMPLLFLEDSVKPMGLSIVVMVSLHTASTLGLSKSQLVP